MNYKCDVCGAFLDPGEKCDCALPERKEHKEKNYMDFTDIFAFQMQFQKKGKNKK